MSEIILPAEIRQCPACQKPSFRAEKAGLGGSWGGQAIRFLYVCSECGHREVIESDASRSSTAFSGFVLVLLGLVMAGMLAAPGNAIVGLLLVGLGGFAIWEGRFSLRRRAPIVGSLSAERRAVPVEETLYASSEEAGKAAIRNRRAAYLIYGTAGLTLIYSVYELLGMN